MPIRLDDPRPPYLQLAAELREAITAGEYTPGDRLPSTRQLAETYEIAPMTVQHAMQVLREEGLVVSHQGRGIYVQEPPSPAADQRDTPKTLDDALAMLAEVQERLDRIESGTAQPAEADAPHPQPGLDQGPEP